MEGGNVSLPGGFWPGAGGFAQDDEAARANALYKAGKRPEALPLYEDLTKAHPSEQLYFERLADCLGAEAVQLSIPPPEFETDTACAVGLAPPCWPLKLKDVALRAITGDAACCTRP